jgi:uncharacterized protein DUF5670
MARVVLFRWPSSTRAGGAVPATRSCSEIEDLKMLWTIAVVLLVLWMFGFLAFHVTSGFIHLLLVLAVVAVVVRLATGRTV